LSFEISASTGLAEKRADGATRKVVPMKVKTNLRAGSGGSVNSGGVNSGGVNGGHNSTDTTTTADSSTSGGTVVYTPPVIQARCVGY
jgi:hypothetical protein